MFKSAFTCWLEQCLYKRPCAWGKGLPGYPGRSAGGAPWCWRRELICLDLHSVGSGLIGGVQKSAERSLGTARGRSWRGQSKPTTSETRYCHQKASGPIGVTETETRHRQRQRGAVSTGCHRCFGGSASRQFRYFPDGTSQKTGHIVTNRRRR